MGQDESRPAAQEPIFADGGKTVIGFVARDFQKQSLQEDIQVSSQRWFDFPGQQAPPIKRLPPQMLMPVTIDDSNFVELQDTPLQPSVQLRNRTSQSLAVSCGSSAVTVSAGRTRRLKVLCSSAQIWQPDAIGSGHALCQVNGLALEHFEGSNSAIVLREIGGVVCAAMEYGVASQNLAVLAQRNIDSESKCAETNVGKPGSQQIEKDDWESRLQDALAQGDEEAVRLALKHL